jgi:ATP-dependent DNA helicase RecG
MLPDDLIEDHFRLIARQKSALKRLGLVTIKDLLWHLPTRYDSISDSAQSNALTVGSSVVLIGKLTNLKAKKLWKSRRNATEGVFEDSSGKVKVLWFNQPYIANMAPQNTLVKLSGKVTGSGESPYISNPEIAPVSADAIPEGMFDQNKNKKIEHVLFPVYPESRGITSKWFYHAMKKIIVSGVLEKIEDPIPQNVLRQYHLPPIKSALIWVHLPEERNHTKAARKRFAFEEIFVIQVAKQKERAENDSAPSLKVEVDDKKLESFIKTFPFVLTGAQRRAVDEITNDFQKPNPMARLLEGDVGSGKTAVAAATSYAVVTSRPPLKLTSGEFGRSPNGDIAKRKSGTLQVAYMAPTEILAGQHFQSFIEHFKKLPINIGLLTGSGCYKFPSKINKEEPTKISRAQLLKWVKNGEIAMLIGTHALIQKSVEFQNLAYVIVDEQHRFGTRQRAALAQKNRNPTESDAVRGAGKADSETSRNTAMKMQGARNEEMRRFRGVVPHFLSMTATPIPRTLALTIYGDLDISVLDELPPGRASVETKILNSKKASVAHEKIREELDAGRQAYVICPRIEEPDPKKAMALRVKSVKTEAERLKTEIFPDKTIDLLHGKLKSSEKDDVMKKFSNGDIDILVATSVVEVGINVPNATTILIEGAERFGLAQLHQLRGRVLRSSHQAYCFLLPEKLGDVAKERLSALVKTQNGFELAESDLKQRGMGDFYGTKQWGITDIGMEALQNPRLIEAARKEAASIVKKDPNLSKNITLNERVTIVTAKMHEE